MRAPFAFYGGYAQLSANAKDQIGESYMLQYLLNQISKLKQGIKERDEVTGSCDDIIQGMQNNSQDDVQLINNLKAELKRKEQELKLE